MNFDDIHPPNARPIPGYFFSHSLHTPISGRNTVSCVSCGRKSGSPPGLVTSLPTPYPLQSALLLCALTLARNNARAVRVRLEVVAGRGAWRGVAGRGGAWRRVAAVAAYLTTDLVQSPARQLSQALAEGQGARLVPLFRVNRRLEYSHYTVFTVAVRLG